MEFLLELAAFVSQHKGLIAAKTIEHVLLVVTAVGFAVLVGVPIGIAITQNKRAAATVLFTAGAVFSTPAIALLVIIIPLLTKFDLVGGYWGALIAIALYAQLPIIHNTYTAINELDPVLREAARGLGMSRRQRLRLFEVPLAIPVIMAGVRTATVVSIGVMAVAAFTGAGGLGVFIRWGLYRMDGCLLTVGIVLLSAIAGGAYYGLSLLKRRLTPVDLRQAVVLRPL